MRPLRNYITVDYTPQNHKELDSGVIITNEDYFDFLELKVLKSGLGCKKVKDGDTVYIRKESLFQADIGDDITFQTREDLVLKTNGKPINKNVTVLPHKDDHTMERVKNGIILPGQVSSAPQKGVVLEVGDDVQYVKGGDTVIMGKYSTMKDGDIYYINEDEILGIIE